MLKQDATCQIQCHCGKGASPLLPPLRASRPSVGYISRNLRVAENSKSSGAERRPAPTPPPPPPPPPAHPPMRPPLSPPTPVYYDGVSWALRQPLSPGKQALPLQDTKTELSRNWWTEWGSKTRAFCLRPCRRQRAKARLHFGVGTTNPIHPCILDRLCARGFKFIIHSFIINYSIHRSWRGARGSARSLARLRISYGTGERVIKGIR